MAANILVVDDELDVRQFLVDLLTDEGYEVRIAEDGLEAWRLIEEQRPDLILLDLLMPNQTGTGLFRRLHGKRSLRDLPVIVISGLAGREVAVSRTVPVFDKPVDAQGLLEAVAKIVVGPSS
jgi:CheY-like chemotaxis protein